jgi:GGDEF domain-containing protein
MLYNYKKDALIMVFKNANATDSFDKADEIRRQLVKSIFVFNENNHLQLTVSQCISEKKRSYNDATVVLLRAEASLKNACKFTRNITIKA